MLVTQHHRVWPFLCCLAYLSGCLVLTAVSFLHRYLQFDPPYAEELIAFIVSASRFRDVAEQLTTTIDDDDDFCSAKGTTKRQLLMDLCELLAKHPDDVAWMADLRFSGPGTRT